MVLNVSEIQIACAVLMGLITLFLVFLLPHYTVAEKHYNNARKILSGSTFLVTIHYIIQYLLQKYSADITITRSIINLLFGIPISYFAYMSYIYMQREGKISLHNWLFAPFILVIQLVVLFIAWHLSETVTTMMLSAYFMALLYTIVLIYYSYLILHKHRRFMEELQAGDGQHLLPFVKYTGWSLILVIIITFGFPLMTFNTHMLMRSIYGLLSISAFFFYIISFAIYGIRFGIAQPGVKTPQEELEEDKAQLSAAKLERMNQAIDTFIKNDTFTQSSLTMKEAADAMGVSVNMLKIWLRNSEYEKYNNWLNALRTAKAKKLMLDNPDISYDEISDRCGFCDRQYFYRQFKKQTGESPAVWIKERIDTH